MRIILIGFMGAGKTTIGRKLSKILNLNFYDLDIYIERKHRSSIPYIFNLIGEEGFRLVEHRTLIEFLEKDNSILSTGGGTPCFYNNIDLLLKKGLTVYLRMTPENLVTRLKSAKRKRPLINKLSEDELLEFVSNQLKNREKFYNKAHLIYDADDFNYTDFVKKIKGELNKFSQN